MPNIRSTSYPERAPRDFNDWQDDLQWERDLERILEDFKYQLREKLRTAYYNNTRSQSVTSSDHHRIQQS